ncbi:site-specific integrase [Pikeienuella piscinae]|uniref:Site-specific integrase n=1 Tax=Pikeienuella piscinae TaxID=2748098 RepID=A0A7L5BXK3_9RHOB|nr:tyrosine-type recombinase/integrase [Pikeienuella piscinae]QIE56655.1 site-specific integrase [Pikeienuella piscinae]
MTRERRRLRVADWPDADRAMWVELFRTGDILDGAGPLAHLRPATRGIHETAYAFWLGFLRDAGVDLAAEAPVERMTDVRLLAYLTALDGLSLASRAQRVHRLYLTLRAAAPRRDWARLRTAALRLQRLESRAGARRLPAAEVSAATLVQLGAALVREAQDDPGLDPVARAVRARDGAAILLLAYCPLRIGNFARLESGRSLLESGDGYVIVIEPEAAKAGRSITMSVAAPAAAALRLWLGDHRPVLAKAERSGAFVWLARTGAPYAPYKFSERIAAITRLRLGAPISAHRFRACAATTIAEIAPDQARIIQPLLTHSTAKVADKAYNRAAMRTAVERYGEALDAVRAGSKTKRSG